MAYLVPSPIRRTYEFSPGVGIVEVAVGGVGVVIGGALLGLALVFHAPYAVRAMVLVIPSGLSIGTVLLKIGGLSLYDQAKAAHYWTRSVRRRLYDFCYPADY